MEVRGGDAGVGEGGGDEGLQRPAHLRADAVIIIIIIIIMIIIMIIMIIIISINIIIIIFEG